MKLIICETVSVHRIPIIFLLHLFLASGEPVRVRYNLLTYRVVLVIAAAAAALVGVVVAVIVELL